MSLELCILASGSMGNCAILRTPIGAMLIDAGIGPRTTARRMNGTGVSLRDIRSICLTHLDSDHFRSSWLNAILRHGIRLFCHETRRPDVIQLTIDRQEQPQDRRRFAAMVHCFDGSAFEPLPGVLMHPLPLAHDRLGSHAFVAEGFGQRVGFASDLGHVPRRLLDELVGVDLLALESNYDPEMELTSGRPAFLKARIMGGSGHLSNQQAFEAIRAILDRCQRTRRRLPEHIVLLHRSRQCNCPRLLRRLFQQDRRIAPRLTLAEQFDRSEWLRARTMRPWIGEQLTLSW
jgi:phosphoribosyl 1,2-cyclic phosphodiesterase